MQLNFYHGRSFFARVSIPTGRRCLQPGHHKAGTYIRMSQHHPALHTQQEELLKTDRSPASFICSPERHNQNINQIIRFCKCATRQAPTAEQEKLIGATPRAWCATTTDAPPAPPLENEQPQQPQRPQNSSTVITPSSPPPLPRLPVSFPRSPSSARSVGFSPRCPDTLACWFLAKIDIGPRGRRRRRRR